METTWVLINRWMGKDMIHLYNEILFSHGKEENPAICNNMNKSWEKQARERKKNTARGFYRVLAGHKWYIQIEESLLKDHFQWHTQCPQNQQALVWYFKASNSKEPSLRPVKTCKGRDRYQHLKGVTAATKGDKTNSQWPIKKGARRINSPPSHSPLSPISC